MPALCHGGAHRTAVRALITDKREDTSLRSKGANRQDQPDHVHNLRGTDQLSNHHANLLDIWDI